MAFQNQPNDDSKNLKQEIKMLNTELKTCEESSKRNNTILNFNTKDITSELITNMKARVSSLINKLNHNHFYSRLKKLLDEDWLNIFGKKLPMPSVSTAFKNNEELLNLFDVDTMQSCSYSFDLPYIYATYDIDLNKSKNSYSKICCVLVDLTFEKYFEAENTDCFNIFRDKSLGLNSDPIDLDDTIRLLDIKNERPSFYLTDSYNRILIRGEEKATSDSFIKAKHLIRLKSFNTNDSRDLIIKYSFAYTVAKNQLYLFLVDLETNDENLIEIYDLTLVYDKCKLVTNMICLAHIFQMYQQYQPIKPNFEFFMPLKNSNGSRTLIYTCYNRIIKIKRIESILNIHDLKEFYRLCTEGELKNTIQLSDFTMCNQSIIISTYPICENDYISNLTNLSKIKNFFHCILTGLKSIHDNNYVHMDVSRSNVVYDAVKNEYLLIDFEKVQKLCVQRNCSLTLMHKYKCLKESNDLDKLTENFINYLIKSELEPRTADFLSVLKKKLKSEMKITQEILNFVFEAKESLL